MSPPDACMYVWPLRPKAAKAPKAAAAEAAKASSPSGPAAKELRKDILKLLILVPRLRPLYQHSALS